MANPSISLPDGVVEDADRRNTTTNRSEYFREALLVRFLLEDREQFDELLEDADSVAHEQPAD